MADLLIPADPTLAAFHDDPERVERRFMVYYAQRLTPTGEALTIKVERPAICEEARLIIEEVKEDKDE
jgi:hypothetical protein